MRPAPALAAAVAGPSALVLGAAGWWLRRNDLPDGFQNEYQHLYTLTEVWFRVRDHGLADAWSALWDGYYPPLPHLVASLGMAVGGVGRDTAVLSQGVFLVALLGATAWLGGRLRDVGTGALAAAVLASWPAIFGAARRYEPNVALAGMVALAAVWLVAGPGLRSVRAALGLGLLAGLALLTDRLAAGVYLAPIAAVALWQEKPWRTGRLGRWGAALAACAATCGYFYARFFAHHLDEITSQLGGELAATGELTQAAPPWTPLGLAWYPLSFVDSQMGLVPACFAFAGVGLYFLRARRDVGPPMRGRLEAWLAGLVLLTLLGKKQPFYAFPLLAPVAVAAALGWRTAPRRLRSVALVVVGVISLHQGLFLTRGEGLVPAPGRWGWFAGVSPLPELFGQEYTLAWAPHEQKLQLDRVAALCAAARDAEHPYALLFSDAQAAYEGQLMPTLRLELDTLLVEGVLMAGEAVQEHAAEASCFVHVTADGGSWPTRPAITAYYRQWGMERPNRGLFAALDGLKPQLRLAAWWKTARDEQVYVWVRGTGAGG